MADDPFKSKFSIDDVERKSFSVEFESFGTFSLYTVRHRLFEGGWSGEIDREIYDTGDAVAVLPYNPETDEVVLVSQFRIPAYHRGMTPWLFECVAGRIHDNEPPEETAIREAKEEAGLDISDVTKVSEMFASPGVFAEFVHLFCARFDQPPETLHHGLDEEGEDIKVIVVKFAEAISALDRGLIKASPAQVCLNWLARHKDDIKRRWSEALERDGASD